MTKLDKLCESAPENYSCIEIARSKNDREALSKRYIIADKNLLSFRSKKVVREMTEEQKEASRERLRKARAKKG